MPSLLLLPVLLACSADDGPSTGDEQRPTAATSAAPGEAAVTAQELGARLALVSERMDVLVEALRGHGAHPRVVALREASRQVSTAAANLRRASSTGVAFVDAENALVVLQDQAGRAVLAAQEAQAGLAGLALTRSGPGSEADAALQQRLSQMLSQMQAAESAVEQALLASSLQIADVETASTPGYYGR